MCVHQISARSNLWPTREGSTHTEKKNLNKNVSHSLCIYVFFQCHLQHFQYLSNDDGLCHRLKIKFVNKMPSDLVSDFIHGSMTSRARHAAEFNYLIASPLGS